MDIVDIAGLVALARDVVKSDGDDDNVLTQNANSAVAIAEGFCRRRLYWTQDALDTDQLTFSDRLTAVETAYQTAKDLYDVPPACPETMQDRINASMLYAAWRKYVAGMDDIRKMTDGILIDDGILAALLLITAHLYKNRQEVVAGAAAAAVQIPMGAQRILETKMAV